MLALIPRGGAAQTYQGGVRGAVRDAGGVVPGADVALVNEETAVERTTISNAVGEYAFPNVAPGVYTLRAVAGRLQDVRKPRHHRRHPGIPDPRSAARSRRGARNDHRDRRIAGDRLDDRVGGTPHRAAHARDAAQRRPQSIRDLDHHAQRHPDGRAAVHADAGSERDGDAGARWRPTPRQQLPARRRADHRSLQSRGDHPVARGRAGSQSAGLHLRCRARTNWRWCLQHHAQVRVERVARQRADSGTSGVGNGHVVLHQTG